MRVQCVSNAQYTDKTRHSKFECWGTKVRQKTTTTEKVEWKSAATLKAAARRGAKKLIYRLISRYINWSVDISTVINWLFSWYRPLLQEINVIFLVGHKMAKYQGGWYFKKSSRWGGLLIYLANNLKVICKVNQNKLIRDFSRKLLISDSHFLCLQKHTTYSLDNKATLTIHDVDFSALLLSNHSNYRDTL